MLHRIALLLLLAQGVAAPAFDGAGERQPDEVRRYRMLLNGRPAGREVFQFWHEGSDIRVVVETAFRRQGLNLPCRPPALPRRALAEAGRHAAAARAGKRDPLCGAL